MHGNGEGISVHHLSGTECSVLGLSLCVCIIIVYLNVLNMTEYPPGPVFSLASYLVRRQYKAGPVFIRCECGRTSYTDVYNPAE